MGSRISRVGLTSADVAAAIAAAKPSFGYAENTTYSTLTTTTPADDTIPQNTEGTQILSTSITLKSTSSKVAIFVNVNGAATSGAFITLSVFRGSGADAICASVQRINADSNMYTLSFVDSPATSGEVTYTVRIGPNTVTNFYLNGNSGGRLLGTTSKTNIIAKEIL